MAISKVDLALAIKAVEEKNQTKKTFHFWLVIDFFSLKSLEPELSVVPVNKEFFCNSPKVAYRQGFELLINSCSTKPFYTNKMPLNLNNDSKEFLSLLPKGHRV